MILLEKGGGVGGGGFSLFLFFISNGLDMSMNLMCFFGCLSTVIFSFSFSFSFFLCLQ